MAKCVNLSICIVMLEEIQRRIELLDRANKNPTLQAVEMASCYQDILYFFNNYTRTDRNSALYDKSLPDVIPFIPYEFQKECILEVWDSIVKWESVFIEKSRQMWISWIIVAIFVYGFLFHNHKYLILSQKQDDVDKLGDMKSLFEKARFIIRNLPAWMMPAGFSKSENMSYMRISRPDGTGSITGESANLNASRWGTYTAIFPDEFAFQSNAESINKAMISASPCRIYTSTPNGMFNEHYRMRKLAMPEVGRDWKTKPAALKWLRYHWSDHPLYTQERYDKKTKDMDSVTIAQELEIDYNTAVKGRVYEDFPTEATNVMYDPSKPLYIAIDNSHWGTDPNAVVVAQTDGAYWNIIDYIEYNSTPEDSAYFLRGTPKMQVNDNMLEFLTRYVTYNYKKAIFIADPYDTKSAMGNSTILDDYRKVGINLMMPQERSKEEQILKTRTNLYRIRYNDNCIAFANFILNAKYPERKEDSNSTRTFTLPVHNQTSHARTALEYLVTYLLENPAPTKSRVAPDTRIKKNPYTRKLENSLQYRR